MLQWQYTFFGQVAVNGPEKDCEKIFLFGFLYTDCIMHCDVVDLQRKKNNNNESFGEHEILYCSVAR